MKNQNCNIFLSGSGTAQTKPQNVSSVGNAGEGTAKDSAVSI